MLLPKTFDNITIYTYKVKWNVPFQPDLLFLENCGSEAKHFCICEWAGKVGTRINSKFVQFLHSVEVSLMSPIPKNSNNKQQNEIYTKRISQ